MGHIVIDIEEPCIENVKMLSNSQTIENTDNISLLKELEAEVYQNGFLAGYVLADLNLYQNVIGVQDHSACYLEDVKKFICQQYFDLIVQIEKTTKKILKVMEVLQYNESLNCNENRDQFLLLFYSIHKQLVMFDTQKLIENTVNMKNIGELQAVIKENLDDLVRKSFSINLMESKTNFIELVCISDCLPKICQNLIKFHRSHCKCENDGEFETENELEQIVLEYDKFKCSYSASISIDPSSELEPLRLTSKITLWDDCEVIVELKYNFRN
uniref:CSON006718 protein n=1 Tax=Culicoides sonorensis TaxID=179676 RepID=A0A336LKD1_CULSO